MVNEKNYPKIFEIVRSTMPLIKFVGVSYGKFNKPWHRDFCYKQTQMESLIQSILFQASIGEFTISGKDIVDGALRITSIRLFLEGSFPVLLNGTFYRFKGLPKVLQQRILQTSLSINTLIGASEADCVQYHHIVNFNGHRSKAHRSDIHKLLVKQLEKN